MKHLYLVLSAALVMLTNGCAVVDATAGAAISITGAVVSTTIDVAGAATSAAIKAASGSKSE